MFLQYLRDVSLNLRLLSIVLSCTLVLASEGNSEQLAAENSRASLAHEQEISHIHFDQDSNLAHSTHFVESLRQQTIEAIKRAEQMLELTLGDLPSLKTNVKFLSPLSFFNKTAAPSWSSALYVDGDILVPLKIDLAKGRHLENCICHEMVHVAIKQLGAGKAAGWIDEGLAQVFEGTPDSRLIKATQEYISNNGVIGFDQLRTGFTGFTRQKAVAAYGQSLVSVQSLANNYGWQAIRGYLDYLRNGVEHENAFEIAFGLTEKQFAEQFSLSAT